MKKALLLLLLLAGCATSNPSRQLASPESAAQSFYDILHRDRISGLPQGNAWNQLERASHPGLPPGLMPPGRSRRLS